MIKAEITQEGEGVKSAVYTISQCVCVMDVL